MAVYDLTPVAVPPVATKHRTIRTKLPVPESVPIFEALAAVHPRITLTVEDHGGDFLIPVHDAEFLARFPDLTVPELVRLLALATKTRGLFDAGKLAVLPRDRWPAACNERVKRDILAVRRIAGGRAG